MRCLRPVVYLPLTGLTSSSLLGPVDPSFGALSRRLRFTGQRHKFNKGSRHRRHMNTVGFSGSKAMWLNDCDVAEPLSDRRLSVYQVVSPKSIPAQIPQRILRIRYIQG